MRRVSILLVAFFVHFLSLAQEPQAVRSLVFESEVWDFGRIEESGGKVSHTFRYRNEADHSVAIERVYSSCGCTTGEYSRRPLKSGAEGEFTVIFDPEGRGGKVDKSITLVYDRGQGRTTLRIKGRVNERPRTVADEFPYDLGGGLRSDASYRHFGRVGQGTTRSMTIALLNNSDERMRLTAEWSRRSGLLEVEIPEELAPHERVLLTLTYALPAGENNYGLRSDSFRLRANGYDSQVEIDCSAIGVDDFADGNEWGARAKIPTVYYELEGLRSGQSGSCQVEITNSGSEPLIVRAVSLREGTELDLAAGEVIAPGESILREMRLRMPEMVAESFIGGVMVVLNDPHKPVRELKIMAPIVR